MSYVFTDRPSNLRTIILSALFFVAILGLGAKVFAADTARTAVGLVGATSVQNPSSNSVNSGSTALGGGLTVQYALSDDVAIETELLYLSHKFSRNTAEVFGTNVSSTFSSGYVHVPLFLRWRPVPILSVGAGPYYSRVVTDWNVSASGFGDRTFDYGKNDFGVAATVGAVVPLGDRFSLFGDLRYARSLTNNAGGSSDSLRFADFQIMVGLRLGML